MHVSVNGTPCPVCGCHSAVRAGCFAYAYVPARAVMVEGGPLQGIGCAEKHKNYVICIDKMHKNERYNFANSDKDTKKAKKDLQFLVRNDILKM